MEKSKRKTLSKAKKDAWTVFALFIRTRDALATTGTLTEALCITCERRYPIKQLQAGHFIPGRHNGILFDKRNCFAQCYGCNVMKSGNSIRYFRKMQKIHGEDVIKELEELDEIPVQFKVNEMLETKEYFKQQLKELTT